MQEREPVIGGLYRHFKNKLYQVKAVAIHSETKEKMIVYQALYGDFAVYVRPYDMFMSEVDHVKYPDEDSGYVSVDEKGNEDSLDNEPVILPVFDEETEAVDDRLMKFLDAEGYAQKLEVLSELRDNLDDKLIDAMAVSMDVEVLPGTIDERYASLRHCIQAHAKYECTRLR